MMTRSKARGVRSGGAKGLSQADLSPTEANIRMQLRSATKGATRRKSLTDTCPVCPH